MSLLYPVLSKYSKVTQLISTAMEKSLGKQQAAINRERLKKTRRKQLVGNARDFDLMHVLDLVHWLEVSPVSQQFSSCPTEAVYLYCIWHIRQNRVNSLPSLVSMKFCHPDIYNSNLMKCCHPTRGICPGNLIWHIVVFQLYLKPARQPCSTELRLDVSINITVLLIQIYREDSTFPWSLSTMVIFPSAELEHGFNGQLY